MAESNNENSNVTTSMSKEAAEEVTKPTNDKITPADRMLQYILSSRALLIIRKTFILEALNQAENEAEAKVDAALARRDALKSDKADVDKGKDNDNKTPPSPPIPDRPVKSPSTVQVELEVNMNQAQAAIRSLKRHGASFQAAHLSQADVQQNLPLPAGNIALMALMAPMAPKALEATTSLPITTRSGRVVKPTREVRDMNEAADKKKTIKAATRTQTRTSSRRGDKGGAPRSSSAPAATTVNTTVTRSGRVVKPR